MAINDDFIHLLQQAISFTKYWTEVVNGHSMYFDSNKAGFSRQCGIVTILHLTQQASDGYS